MARLARAAYAVVWVNPLKGTPSYEPLARRDARGACRTSTGSSPGTIWRAWKELAGVLAGIERRHAA